MSRVFEDHSGARRRHLLRFGWALAVLLSVVATVFGVSLILVPLIAPPRVPRRTAPLLVTQNQLHKQERSAVLEQKKRHKAGAVRPARAPAGTPLAVAFFAPWEDAGLESFRAHAGQLNYVVPAWVRLGDDGQSLDLKDFDLASNPRNKGLIEAARLKQVGIVPLISNAQEGVFDPKTVRRLLADPARQEKFISNVRGWLLANQFQGVNIDFELITEKEWPDLGRFLAKLSADLQQHGLIVTADLEAFLPSSVARAAVEACDWVVVMAYDEHSEEGAAGPIASRDWANRVWDRWAKDFDTNKLVVAVGSYGYDWTPKGQATSLSFDEVLSTAKGYREGEQPADVIEIDHASRNPWFTYEDDAGARHTVWFLDAITAFNQWSHAQEDSPRGIALWVLGNEDPAIWTFLDKSKLNAEPDASGLGTISFPYDVNFMGRGEILQVKERPQVGERSVELSDGEIHNWTYKKYAFPFILEKSGYSAKKLVLTFDDGPDPEFTPKIVRKLKELKAPATFFVVGEAAVRYPRLMRELDRAGFEIGSHSYTHPDLGAAGERWTALELNATQRALEAILGRSTRLFRPPYNADSQPETAAQVLPIEVADRLNYLTIGENVDPEDWKLRQEDPDGTVRKKTGHDIAQAVIRDVEARAGSGDEGNIILLHDSGGDRTATIDSLEEMVARLRARGYQFVSLSELLGQSRDALMPPISPKDLGMVGVDRVVFGAAAFFGALLRVLFITGIIIGVVRAVMVTVLALRNRSERRFRGAEDVTAGVVIAAYNEESVIAHTVRSVLDSRFALREVIVVDDGSTDRTAEVVRAEFGSNPKVRLIQKPNGGKASALNVGFAQATADVLICVDADTVLHPDAAKLLLRHFDSTAVAAVAGNVRVGNSRNLLTRWQSLEYTTSQNLDRRAAETLNAITVVPGAIGAWRRTAVIEAGGYATDTLAEDMDLTWRLRRAGYRIENETEALSFTEAPQSMASFFKQRFRWAYGTLQCLWKHRAALGRHEWFGRFALPQLWLFQVVFQVLAPLIDLTVMLSLIRAASVWLSARNSSIELDQLAVVEGDLALVLGCYGLFFAIELAQAWIAYWMEKRTKGDLWFLFLQRVAYRQIMYAVIWKAIWRALSGGSTPWGKLRRLGLTGEHHRAPATVNQ